MADPTATKAALTVDSDTHHGAHYEVWQLDDLVIEVPARTVSRDGSLLRVTGLSFDLFVTLLRATPGTVDQDTLIETVWGGRVVSPETVTKRVELLREALGDDASSPRYIGLVWGHGYKLLAGALRLEEHGSVSPTQHRQPPLAWALGLVTVLVVVAYLINKEQLPTPSPETRPGIAVLPFTAGGVEPEQAEFLAAGLHDDIITDLAQIKGLLVISRTSVLAFRDKHVPLTEIGRTLNVDKILEGHVQRAASKVKLNVQLIDAKRDQHLWAKTYESEVRVTDVLALQRRIAADVAATFKMSLTDASAHSEPPTENRRAYDHYLVARQLKQRAWESGDRPENRSKVQRTLSEAVTELEAAVAEDPAFAEAYALLSTIHTMRYGLGFDATQSERDHVASALMKAIELRPHDPWVRRALGQYYAMIGDYTESLRELERAVEGLPQETDLLVDLGSRHLLEGRFDEAREVMERAVLQDPLDVASLSLLSTVKRFSGDFEGALTLNQRLQALQPDDLSLLYVEADLRFLASGDLPAYKDALEDLPIVDVESTRAQWGLAMMARDYARALAILRDNPFDDIINFVLFNPYTYYTGLTYLMAGNQEQAVAEFQAARRTLEAARRAGTPQPPSVMSCLAEVLAALGEREAARELVQETLNSAAFENYQFPARIWSVSLLRALTLNNDLDLAQDLLDSQHNLFGDEFWRIQVHAPVFAPLRALPRYSELAHRFDHSSDSPKA